MQVKKLDFSDWRWGEDMEVTFSACDGDECMWINKSGAEKIIAHFRDKFDIIKSEDINND